MGDTIIKILKSGYLNKPTLYIIKPPRRTRGKAKVTMVVYKTKSKPKQKPSIDIEEVLGLLDE